MSILLHPLLWGLMLIPVFVFVVAYLLKREMTGKQTFEYFLLTSFSAFFVGSLALLVLDSYNVQDTLYVNGVVTNKYSEKVSCSHSYNCHCHPVTSCSGSGKNRSCSTSTHCDTCYEHSFDVDWMVESSIPNRFDISREDRQGLTTPHRWDIIAIGEPVTDIKGYRNQLRNDTSGLFVNKGLDKDPRWATIPEYTPAVFDYYKASKVYIIGRAPVANVDAWNHSIAVLNGTLGPSKSVNVSVVFVNSDESIFELIRSKWYGGKKNDVIPVFGVDKQGVVTWVEVLSLSHKELFKVQLKDRLTAAFLGKSIQEPGQEVVFYKIALTEIYKGYERVHQAELDSLASETLVEVPSWLSALLAVLTLVGSTFILSIYRKGGTIWL